MDDRSQEMIEREERCACGDAWRLAKKKKNSKLKEKDKATFFSPTDEWNLPSTTKPEERDFVVNPGASMHMISRKDLNPAELDTVKVLKNPTTVVTANGEVQTKEEATVYDSNEELRGDPLRDLPEWLEEFTENLVDDSVPEHRDASCSSHELLSEPRAKVVSGEHGIFTHFPKDRNCDICLRTKITRAPCRRRTGPVVRRAEKW